MQLMRCNHCPFGRLGRFLQLLQRRLFGPFVPRTEFSMGSMWKCPNLFDRARSICHPLGSSRRRNRSSSSRPRTRGSSSAPRRRFSSGEFAPIDGSSFIHVTCVTCPVAGEITIRQAQVTRWHPKSLQPPLSNTAALAVLPLSTKVLLVVFSNERSIRFIRFGIVFSWGLYEYRDRNSLPSSRQVQ
jgi:hypothetical protein